MHDEPPQARSAVPFPLQELVPAELRGVLCDFVWDADKLRHLPLPIDTVTVDSLRWHLDLPYWRRDGKPFQLTPAQVKADPRATGSSTSGRWQPTSVFPLTCCFGTTGG
jgi:hypothetical protein